jgi:YidC/Oxa1 family membrane protein insertase
MAVLGASMYFMPSQAPVAPVTAPSVSATAVASAMSADQPKVSPASSTKTKMASVPSNVPAQSVTIDTDEYTAVFSNEGAILTGFYLKKYENRQLHQAIDLVDNDPSRPKPFALVYGPLAEVNQKHFAVVGGSKKLSGKEKAQLVFRASDASGTVVEKTFDFNNGSYLIDCDVRVAQTHGSVPASTLSIEWGDTLGPEDSVATSRTPGYQVATFVGGKIVSTEKAKKSKETIEIPGPITWTALTNQFFMAALLPNASSGGNSVRVAREYGVYVAGTQENPAVTVSQDTFGARPILNFDAPALRGGESFERKLQVFFGPQDYDLLKKLNLQLENVVDFGFFGFLSVYMLELLKWFYTLVHNWGLAIILLSVAVKLLLWIPTHNSYKSMSLMQKKMKEIQPKLEALKRKYPDDKQKQQQEQMAIYSQAGINPMSGCLPLLLQMPVFWALYATLGHSIELRGASFLWLHDLSLKDPFYVFPLLMGATMLLQQKVSGQMANQAAGQQKVMLWLMPGLLTFMSFQWPAGLLVYWVTTNVLSMIQQKIVNREVKNHEKKEGK